MRHFYGDCGNYAAIDCTAGPAALHCKVVSGKCVKKTPEERRADETMPNTTSRLTADDDAAGYSGMGPSAPAF